MAAIVDLLHVLPARDAERAGDDRKSVFVRVQRRALETHVEAHGAAHAALGFVLHTLGPGEPVVLVVVRIDEGYAELLRETDVLVLAQNVFLQGMDIGVIEEDCKVNAGGQHRFHHLPTTGGAAGMQQHLVLTTWQRQERACKVGFLIHIFTLRGCAARMQDRLNPPYFTWGSKSKFNLDPAIGHVQSPV